MAYVQSAGNSVPIAATVVQAFGSNVGNNSTLVVYSGRLTSTSPTIVSIIDTIGNTYTQQEEVDSTAGFRFTAWVAKCPTGGANTVTITFSGSSGYGTILVAEYSGRDTTNPVTAHAQNDQASPGTGANGITCGPITAATGDDIVLGMLDVTNIVANNFTAGTSYTERREIGSGTSNELDSMLESRDNVSSGSQSATATQGQNDQCASIVIALAAAGGATRTLFYQSTLDGLSTQGPKQFNPGL